MNQYTVKMIKMMILIGFVIHFNACVIFFVPSIMGFEGHFPIDHPRFEVFGPTWPFLRNLTNVEPSVQYSWSIFKDCFKCFKKKLHLGSYGRNNLVPHSSVEFVFHVLKITHGSNQESIGYFESFPVFCQWNRKSNLKTKISSFTL